MKMNRLGLSSRALGWMAIYAQYGWQVHEIAGSMSPFDGYYARHSDGCMWRKDVVTGEDVLCYFDPAGDKVLFEVWDGYGRLIDEWERDMPALYTAGGAA